ncbi:hypothetical protein [Pararhizobium mangrovi]|uniref:Uncharacterized protein n=1 Tax=Pararhizobium mangrovi TaxID=2590452 RepID=A0A506UHJ0_9HYPH|nr:hypothetical protein [Pararhizobium mangrovi]TPW32768.1 hypothetical protein FJU11_00650 [Pararhizobium mangrovi]
MAARFTRMPLAAGLAMALAGAAYADSGSYEIAATDCNSAAQRVVSNTGGQLLSVSATTEGGKSACRVTVLVPSKGDKRPRKVTKTVSK